MSYGVGGGGDSGGRLEGTLSFTLHLTEVQPGFFL
jgi:hypothetical protein